MAYAPPGRAAEIAATGGQGGVAIFSADGTLIKSFTDSHLGSPWGLVLAPSNFGQFSGDLLVGNFAYGNIGGVSNPVGGLIDAYDANGNFLAYSTAIRPGRGCGLLPLATAAMVAILGFSISRRDSTQNQTACSLPSRLFRNQVR